MSNTATQNTELNKEQKQATLVLSIGTFLEYFDLMLYLHLWTFLSDVFFPQTSAYMQDLIKSTGFLTTFAFRPIGAYLFGYIGDKYGRKSSVIISTTMMAISCIIIAKCPSYNQIGIYASIIILVCRTIQSLSSMGEIIGASIYTSELTHKYQPTAIIGFASEISRPFALGMATLITSLGFDWNTGFYIGAVIAVLGFGSRTTLSESKDFLQAKQIEKSDIIQQDSPAVKLANKVNPANVVSYFLLSCPNVFIFYFNWVHCAGILSTSFKYSKAQVICNNFFLSVLSCLASILIIMAIKKYHPLKILKIRFIIAVPFFIISPFLLSVATKAYYVVMIQMASFILNPRVFPAGAVLNRTFPVLQRFKILTMTFAVAQALMAIVTSFCVPIIKMKFSSVGLLIVIVPLLIGFWYGLQHFYKLETERIGQNL